MDRRKIVSFSLCSFRSAGSGAFASAMQEDLAQFARPEAPRGQRPSASGAETRPVPANRALVLEGPQTRVQAPRGCPASCCAPPPAVRNVDGACRETAGPARHRSAAARRAPAMPPAPALDRVLRQILTIPAFCTRERTKRKKESHVHGGHMRARAAGREEARAGPRPERRARLPQHKCEGLVDTTIGAL